MAAELNSSGPAGLPMDPKVEQKMLKIWGEEI